MNLGAGFSQELRALLFCAAVLFAVGSASAQVSPAEILNPRLRAAEAKYMSQLQSLHSSIEKTKFPFAFALARYVNGNINSQAGFDSRGIEFVLFQDRILLKISGVYSAAYNSAQLTANQRADRTFREAVLPVLRLVGQELPADVACDDIGFEIAYYTRGAGRNFDFEGKENVAIVLSRADAFALPGAAPDQQQEIINRSRIYLNGKDFGLALGETDPLNVEALDRVVPADRPARPATIIAADSGSRPAGSDSNRVLLSSRTPDRGLAVDEAPPAATAPIHPAAIPVAPKPSPTPADAERLQSQYQTQLDSLVKTDGAKLHLVDYAPPSFAIYHDQIVLQFTLRNPTLFDKTSGSIYKRAAQSFDLFLAPQLKLLLQKLPTDAALDDLDFSILNRVGSEKDSSEAVEFICPLKSVRSFTDDAMTTQDLISHSIVLVNGVRISLNLQAVE
jgi:hypothetical protein